MIQTADEFNDNRDEKTRALYAAAYEAQQEEQADDAGLQSIRESLSGYTVFNAIGAGGQGRVYSGVRESTNQSVAIKVLNGGAFSSRREMKRFWREIAILRRLKHPGIVNIYDSGTINRAPYLVMERIVGVQIDCIAITTGMNLRQRIELFLQACAAVSAAHAQGIIHRDLKPANILVESVFDDDDDDKEEMFVRLLDFGLAKDMSEDHPASSSNLSMTGCRVGTARYSSPEQIKGRPVDVQTDIYSLGVVLFELLSGQLPYIQNDKEYGDVALVMHGRRRGLRDAIKATNVLNPALCPYSPKDVGRDLETILDTATTVEPDLRYGTVDEFADDLRRYLDGKSINAQISVVRRIRSRAKAYRRKLVAVAVIAAFATVSAIGGFSWHNAKEADRRSKEMALISLSGLHIGRFVKQATAFYNDREPTQAIAMLQQAVDLAALVPTDDPLICRQAYQAYYNLAEYYFETDRPEEASPYCEKAIELSDALRTSDPTDLLFMRLGSYSHRLSGRVLYARAKWKAALLDFETMLTIREHLAEREPGVPHRRQELADAHTWIGRTARKGGQLDKAVQHHQAACSILTELFHTEPEVSEYPVRLSNAEGRLGSTYMCYKTADADVIAMETLLRARERLVGTKGTSSQKNRIAVIINLIEENIATLEGRRSVRRSRGSF